MILKTLTNYLKLFAAYPAKRMMPIPYSAITGPILHFINSGRIFRQS